MCNKDNQSVGFQQNTWEDCVNRPLLRRKKAPFPSLSSLSKVGSSKTFGLLQAGLRDCSQPLPL